MLGDDAALVQEGVAAHETRATGGSRAFAEELDLRALARSEALAHRQQIVDRGPQALDAIAAQRRRLPMVEMPDYTLIGADGPVRLVDVFDGRSQLIVYNHMWTPGAEWQCGGCTGFTSQFSRR